MRNRPLDALMLLGKIPDPQLLSTIVGLAVIGDRDIEGAAIHSLGEGAMSFPGAGVVLASLLRANPTRNRLLIVWALRRVLLAHPSIILQLEQDPSPMVRRIVLQCAEAVCPRTGTPKELAQMLLDMVERSAADGDELIRATAYQALGMIGAPGSYDLLRTALYDHSEKVRIAAVHGMGRQQRLGAFETLVDLLGTSHGRLRREVLRSLAGITLFPSREWISQALAQPSMRRTTILRALGTQAKSMPLQEILPFLNDAEAATRRQATYALASCARTLYPQKIDSQIVDALLLRLDLEREPTVLDAVVEALAFSGDERVIHHFLTRMSQAPAFLRERFLEALSLVELLTPLPAPTHS
jgi:HEAT repeat protein